MPDPSWHRRRAMIVPWLKFLARHVPIAFLMCSSACVSHAPDDIPAGYVLQHLDASDGKIAKPKDWFYHSSGTPSGLLYTFSAEDPSKNGGNYETGFRIQLFVGVAKGTKRTTEGPLHRTSSPRSGSRRKC